MLAHVATSTWTRRQREREGKRKSEKERALCAPARFSERRWCGAICRTRKGFPESPRAIFTSRGKSTVSLWSGNLRPSVRPSGRGNTLFSVSLLSACAHLSCAHIGDRSAIDSWSAKWMTSLSNGTSDVLPDRATPANWNHLFRMTFIILHIHTENDCMNRQAVAMWITGKERGSYKITCFLIIH